MLVTEPSTEGRRHQSDKMSNTAGSAAALSTEAVGATHSSTWTADNLISSTPNCTAKSRTRRSLSFGCKFKMSINCPELGLEWMQETATVLEQSSPPTDGWRPWAAPVMESIAGARWRRRYDTPDDGSALNSNRRQAAVAARTQHHDSTAERFVWRGYKKLSMVVERLQSSLSVNAPQPRSIPALQHRATMATLLCTCVHAQVGSGA